MSELVLSLFPGIGLLDMAFEMEGFTVVRGPDLLWGGDVRNFHPPAGRFDGVIGGPPCQTFSFASATVKVRGHETKFGNLIPEFERCISEARPRWFVMENVKQAPVPVVDGYKTVAMLLNNRWFGDAQYRIRRFSFGGIDPRPFLEVALFESPEWQPAVLAGHDDHMSARERLGRSRTWQEMAVIQGLPPDFDLPGFTEQGKRSAIGNGVPLPMGRAVAKAVRRAAGSER